MKNENIVILIPAYNPTKDLIKLTNELINKNFSVVVINDGSKKDSSSIFDKLNKKVNLLIHDTNKGKGQALKTGFKYIINNITTCKGIVTADADGQHLVKDILNIAKELNNNPNALILGSRKQDKNMLLKSRLGNSITRMVFKFITKTKVYDTQTGLRGIPYNYLENFINIDGNRYEYEINMLLYCAKNKISIKEIPIATVYINGNTASSFNVIKDSIKIYKCILKDSDFLNIILFGLSAILSFIIDFSLLLLLKKITCNLDSESISLLISVVGARIISSLFNFTFNRNVVFKNNNTLLKSLAQYYILVVFVIIANYLLLNLLTVKLNFNLIISKILVEVILFISNYIIQKLFIFKKKSI